ncbi:hypothetical protein EV356DRAFT_570915 [Viridothelium virens]|uniref:Aflatoxin regulatory protein domain-containing protein n=1 Tax=Viridothelium virens TaxID=1048519 RepID=A0A6A6GV61_VIRVR|nr:hypothetical protein EV356DRAFT_570915 [Viridothelium virens]
MADVVLQLAFMEGPHPGDPQDLNNYWAQHLTADLDFDLENDSDFQAFLESPSYSTSSPVQGRATRLQDFASSLTADTEELTTRGSNGHLSRLMFDQNNLIYGNRAPSTTRDSTIRQGHEESFGPSKPNDSGARSIDSVLMTNREALQLVSSILQNASSTSSQLQLLLTVICSKAAAWYRAIARNSLEPNASVRFYQAIHDPSRPSKASSEELVERVRHQPIKFGTYSFDSALETKIRVMVVLNELQNATKLFANLSEHVTNSGFATSISNAAPASGPIDSGTDHNRAAGPSFGVGLEEGSCTEEATRRRLKEFLSMQLDAVKAEPRGGSIHLKFLE